MEKYAIGLDIGVASVGWAAVALDEREEPCAILDMGVRIFTAAENPQDGASLAAPRREKRSMRRRIRRRRHRKERIQGLIVSSGLLDREEQARLYEGKLSDVYELRVRALDEKLSREEFARVLLHLAQRRGFKSNRKGDKSKEDGELLKAVGENARRMEAKGYRTVGEMLFRDEDFAAEKRNHRGEYKTTVTRAMVEDEARKIFAAQRKCGNAHAGEDFEAAYLNILLAQRSFDEGPGEGSPYGGDMIYNRVGACTFFTDEKRAPKASYSFEYFSLLEKVNHIRLVEGGESLPLSEGQRKKLIELAHSKDNLNFHQIRKELAVGENQHFNFIRYDREKSREEVEKKEKFKYLKAYHEMRKAVEKAGKGRFALLTKEQRNDIAHVLSYTKAEENVRRKLAEAGIESCDIEQLVSLDFSGNGHISIKACEKLIPYLEQGMKYNEACAAAGIDFRAHKGGERRMTLLPLKDDCPDITSPVVRRAVSQTIKVINAIIRRYDGSPSFVNIELAREMSKDFEERNKIKKEQEQNHARNERIMEQIREYKKARATGQDIVKFRLYEEQGGVSAYSQKQMSLERLFEPGYAEIDHIIPYSISFDDSYKNKALVLKKENQDKGKRLPMQYLSGERRDKFVVWVNSSVRDYAKRQKLLKESIDEEDKRGFRERNLQDTKFISSFMLNYINDNLLFAPSEKRKKRVTAVNGAVTDYMRKRWMISKRREDGDMHHAVDALVVACTTDGMIQRASRYIGWHEERYVNTGMGSSFVDPDTGEVLVRFPYPWPWFKDELEARLSHDPAKAVAALKLPYYEGKTMRVKPIFVSRMPRRKVKGAAHEATIRSPKVAGYKITKTPLNKLKLVLEEGKYEIKDYYNKRDDDLLYNALIQRLLEFGKDAEKAFKEPFYKPKRDGSPGPRVDKVKIMEKSSLSVPVNGGSGIADNSSMVRIDVFHVEGDGSYLVPIYVADTLKKELPNRACVAHKSYSEWKEMKPEDFLFSLYPNDLVKIRHRSNMSLKKQFKESSLPETFECREELFYYVSADIAGGKISAVTHDNSYELKGLGIKTLELMEKYTVDVLGEYHKVEKEERQGFDIRRN